MEALPLTVEQKLTKAMLDLRRLHPFYSGVYEVVEKQETTHPHIETIGVTPKKILYHKENLNKLPYPELLFTLLQAVSSLALKHGARQGKRDPQLWSIAMTLYVNKLLSVEFGFSASGETVNHRGVLITMPITAMFAEHINIERDFVEQIYDKLKVVEGAQDFGSISGQSTSEQTSPESLSPEEQEELKKALDHTSHEESFGEQTEEEGGIHPPDTIQMIETFEDQLTKEREADQLMKNASTKTALLQNAAGVGSTPCLLQRTAEKKENSVVDWKKLLRHYLTASLGGDLSYRRPDPRFFSLDLILPSPSLEDETDLRGIKVCIDTSGSISQEKLGYFYQQVDSLCKEFKITADLLFWDAEILEIAPLESRKDLNKSQALGGGGTEPDCLFRYFESRQCKVKPLVTLIFTDGYVSTAFDTPSRKRNFKNTLWIMTEKHNTQFKPSFGKVTIPRFPPNI